MLPFPRDNFYIPTWTCSVYLQANYPPLQECQLLSYDLLGNRMCVAMNTVVKQNSEKSVTSSRHTSYSAMPLGMS